MRDFTLVLRGALFCALALLLGSSLRAQRTWVVDNSAGPNHDFTALMDAHMPQWRQYREMLSKAPLGHEEWEY